MVRVRLEMAISSNLHIKTALMAFPRRHCKRFQSENNSDLFLTVTKFKFTLLKS